jgi:hypothetical protein
VDEGAAADGVRHPVPTRAAFDTSRDVRVATGSARTAVTTVRRPPNVAVNAGGVLVATVPVLGPDGGALALPVVLLVALVVVLVRAAVPSRSAAPSGPTPFRATPRPSSEERPPRVDPDGTGRDRTDWDRTGPDRLGPHGTEVGSCRSGAMAVP